MNKKDKKIICILLIIIILFSLVLLFKITKSEKQIKELRNKVYEEYNKISEIEINTDLSNTIDSSDTIHQKQTAITIGKLEIPKIGISYPIINICSDINLEVAPCRIAGPYPNKPGNLVIAGHNNWNKAFFSNLYKLKKDDLVYFTDISGRKLKYKIYDKYEVDENDLSCLEQDTNEQTEITLLTCVKYKKKKRLIIKCRN